MCRIKVAKATYAKCYEKGEDLAPPGLRCHDGLIQRYSAQGCTATGDKCITACSSFRKFFLLCRLLSFLFASRCTHRISIMDNVDRKTTISDVASQLASECERLTVSLARGNPHDAAQAVKALASSRAAPLKLSTAIVATRGRGMRSEPRGGFASRAHRGTALALAGGRPGCLSGRAAEATACAGTCNRRSC